MPTEALDSSGFWEDMRLVSSSGQDLKTLAVPPSWWGKRAEEVVGTEQTWDEADGCKGDCRWRAARGANQRTSFLFLAPKTRSRSSSRAEMGARGRPTSDWCEGRGGGQQ